MVPNLGEPSLHKGAAGLVWSSTLFRELGFRAERNAISVPNVHRSRSYASSLGNTPPILGLSRGAARLWPAAGGCLQEAHAAK